MKIATRIGKSPAHNGVRTESHGTSHGHGRVDTKGPGWIGGGCHHAPLLRSPADEHRFVRKVGVFQHLDGGKKGVQIQVNDGSWTGIQRKSYLTRGVKLLTPGSLVASDIIVPLWAKK